MSNTIRFAKAYTLLVNQTFIPALPVPIAVTIDDLLSGNYEKIDSKSATLIKDILGNLCPELDTALDLYTAWYGEKLCKQCQAQIY